MARLISDILQAPEPEFSHRLELFERLAGRPGHNLRLLSEIIQHQKKIIGMLGLDAEDTNIREYYHALNKKALIDSDLLSKKLGINPSHKPNEVAEICIKYVKKVIGSPTAWALKSSVQKEQFKKNTPKKTLKLFGLKSVDSAIKREPMNPIYIFAPFIENKTWLDKYYNQAQSLTALDFAESKIEIEIIKERRRNQLSSAGVKLNQVIFKYQETASILVVPPSSRFDGDVLFVVNGLLEAISSIRLGSLYIKKSSMKDGFSKKMFQIRKQGIAKTLNEEHPTSWKAEAIASNNENEEFDVSLFDEHADKDHFSKNYQYIFGENTPWVHSFVVVYDDNRVVSSNLSDVIINAINNIPSENAYNYYGKNELKAELYKRYAQHPEVAEHIKESRSEKNG